MRYGSMLIVAVLLSLTAIASAQSNAISTTCSPSNPVAGTDVTFYATIDGENVSQVKVWIEECSNTICSLPKEINMVKTGGKNYTATYALKEDTIYFHYKVMAQIDGEQTESEMYNITVTSQSGGNSDGTNSTPGFEILELAAVLSVLVLFRRK